MLRLRTTCTSWSTEKAFLWPGGLVRSKIFTALSAEPEKSVGFMGWKARQVMPSTWSCKVLTMGFMSSSSVMRMRARGPSVLTAQARMRAQSRILMLPSRKPVAQKRPSVEKAAARQGQACWCCAVYSKRISGARRVVTPCVGGSNAGMLPGPGTCTTAPAAAVPLAAAPAVPRSKTCSWAPSGGTGVHCKGVHSPTGSSPKAHFKLFP
mmetsp:Transcript_116030/g.374811  ORF Transcript_116030/g.374811 Transcript_116030/m.374811 type:complete len:209 (+) Transcript_116030:691-1317(+)